MHILDQESNADYPGSSSSGCKVYVWGLNDKDQLGGMKGSKVKLPVLSEFLSHLRPIHIAGGSKSLFIVSQEGKVGISKVSRIINEFQTLRVKNFKLISFRRINKNFSSYDFWIGFICWTSQWKYIKYCFKVGVRCHVFFFIFN